MVLAARAVEEANDDAVVGAVEMEVVVVARVVRAEQHAKDVLAGDGPLGELA